MSEVLIIVVIYNTNVEKIEYLSTLENIDILIYDNSPEKQVINSDYHYIHDSSNPGVSTAYNKGVELSVKLGKEYLLILDQDTEFSLDTFQKYMKAKEKYGDKYLYASIVTGKGKIYSPCIEKKNKNLCQDMNKFKYEEIYDLKGKSLINSGLMIPTSLAQKVGFYNEKIKLDFSDFYFIEKYKQLKGQVVLINTCLTHSISGDEGKNKSKELARFRYYCNGAREFKKSFKYYSRTNRLVIYRTLRLILKYKSLQPISIAKEYYLGDSTI